MRPTDPTTPSSLPVGSIICFAGDLSVAETRDQLKAAGWLLCDGTELKPNDYPELFRAIGRGKDSAGQGRFALPDLRDRFLRGRRGTGREDRLGVPEESATALPASTPFTVAKAGVHTHTVQHLNTNTWPAWKGSTYAMAHGDNIAKATTAAAGAHAHTLTGFDDATVPVNVTLYYIIKAAVPASADGHVPAGTIAGFLGGADGLEPWLLCDGKSYATTRFPSLSTSLSFNYGGDGTSAFNVPDLRGQFLRGTSHDTHRDPDAKERFASNPGGATGDETGSAQGFATAAPPRLVTSEDGEHTHNIAHIPHEYHNVALGASGPLATYSVVWTDDTTTSASDGEHTHATVTGGDGETRPANVSADWLIAAQDVPGAPPIGSVVPTGADTTDRDNVAMLMERGWLPCDGEKLKISDSRYSALYAVIGTTYGSNPQHFMLPDLRGYFIQGAGGKSKAGAVRNQSQTGKPTVAMTTSTDGSHTHTIPNVPQTVHVIDVVMGKQIAEWNDTEGPTSAAGRHSHRVTGGDKESRPANVNVDYVIRYR